MYTTYCSWLDYFCVRTYLSDWVQAPELELMLTLMVSYSSNSKQRVWQQQDTFDDFISLKKSKRHAVINSHIFFTKIVVFTRYVPHIFHKKINILIYIYMCVCVCVCMYIYGHVWFLQWTLREKGILYAWSTKCSLFVKIFLGMNATLRAESNEPN